MRRPPGRPQALLAAEARSPRAAAGAGDGGGGGEGEGGGGGGDGADAPSLDFQALLSMVSRVESNSFGIYSTTR